MEELASIDFPTSIYLFKANHENIRTSYDNCSKLIIKSTERTERQHWRLYDAFIFNCEQISHVGLVFPLLTLNKQILVGLIQTGVRYLSNACLSRDLHTLKYFFKTFKLLKVWNELIKTITTSVVSASFIIFVIIQEELLFLTPPWMHFFFLLMVCYLSWYKAANTHLNWFD